jgi:protein SCO1/2
MPLSSLLRTASAAVVLATSLSFSGGAAAAPVPASEQLDRTEPLPARLKGIDVREHLSEMVAKGAAFIDEGGRHVTLGDFLDGERPVILTLNYSRCPMLCSLELNGLVGAMKDVDFTAGKDFRIVTVVLDPNEKPEEARASKTRYVRQRPSRSRIGLALLDRLGSEHPRRRRLRGLFPSATTGTEGIRSPGRHHLLTPTGKGSHLYGIEYKPRPLKLSLAESGEGRIGTSVDQLILYCFHYDETEGRYAPVAMNIMRVGGALTVVVPGSFLTTYFLSESRKKKKATSASTSEGSARSATT